MAKVRGIRPTLPKKGGAPTGIFSTKGRQKRDATTGKHTNMCGNKLDGARVGPVRRDNGLK